MRGYGTFIARPGVMYSAHRFAYEMANGISEDETLHVLHSCDNPSCVNPKHLRLGTIKENMRDVHRRNRNKKTKIPQSIIPLLKIEYEQNKGKITQEEIGKRYGVSQSQISAILCGSRRNYI